MNSINFIPIVDLKSEYEFLKSKVISAIQTTIEQSDFVLGPSLKEFENNFAKYIGTRYAVGVASGTDAIYLSLKALNLDIGSEVMIPSFTFISTLFAVVQARLTPMLIDIDPANYCIDISQIEKKMNRKTRCIIPVHLFGYPSNLEVLSKFCYENNIYLVEDVCQAHGAEYNNRKLGSVGITGCFSFYPAKNLGGYGDGGLITTNDYKVYENIKCSRNWGQSSKYEHDYFGMNSRLDSIQSAILNVKLQYLDEFNKRRRERAALYRKLLKDIPIVLPPEDTQNTYQVYHQFVIRSKVRDKLYDYLRMNNIGVAIHYHKPLHYQKYYRDLFLSEQYPVAEQVCKEVLSLPMHPFLKDESIDYICNTIKNFF